jgi:hypothetical protein
VPRIGHRLHAVVFSLCVASSFFAHSLGNEKLSSKREFIFLPGKYTQEAKCMTKTSVLLLVALVAEFVC